MAGQEPRQSKKRWYHLLGPGLYCDRYGKPGIGDKLIRQDRIDFWQSRVKGGWRQRHADGYCGQQEAPAAHVENAAQRFLVGHIMLCRLAISPSRWTSDSTMRWSVSP